MMKLSEKQYWDSYYRARLSDAASDERPSLRPPPSPILKGLLGKLRDYTPSYREHLLWDVLFQRYMSGRTGQKVLEVGSAPGDFLVRLHQRFGLVPYGVDYSETGVEANRRTFAAHGIDPDNVIHADFLSDDFLQRWRERFDIVISNGFVEHFQEAETVIQRHVELLAPGGLLIVMIPNLRGMNFILTSIFHKEFLRIHNLEIMRLERFRKLFRGKGLTPLRCGYVGTFDFHLFGVKPGSPMVPVLAFCKRAQALLNVFFRLTLRSRGYETRLFSPCLFYIGRKADAHSPHASKREGHRI